ncbi:hypothetical protein CVT24_009582 [Panaeolus cyanescens]|uniref:Uncharacterized protein n=1 Tax=Panaeolus cyanescens TaxID=181874 RepID=A0A409YA74_9AGAR|nr:hypothetical protein CVT24_009582 [Panaeolus cyanescens]
MHPSLRCSSARAHTPLIKFIGKRVFKSTPDARHPHPAAPLEFKQRFSEFLEKMNASTKETTSSPASNAYSQFWEAPERLWRPRVRQLSDKEIDAIMSGGASSY